MKAQLEHNIGHDIEPDAVILQWLVRWSGVVLNRYSVGQDGITAYERIRTRPCTQPLARIGENVWYKEARRKTQARSINTDWHEGIWAGIAVRTGETIILTQGGAVRAWILQIFPEKYRWDWEFLHSVKWTISQPNPNMPGQHIPIQHTHTHTDSHTTPTPTAT